MKLKYEELSPSLHEVYCKTCGKHFWTTNAKKITCSPRCSNLHRLEMRREAYRKRKGAK